MGEHSTVRCVRCALIGWFFAAASGLPSDFQEAVSSSVCSGPLPQSDAPHCHHCPHPAYTLSTGPTFHDDRVLSEHHYHHGDHHHGHWQRHIHHFHDLHFLGVHPLPLLVPIPGCAPLATPSPFSPYSTRSFWGSRTSVRVLRPVGETMQQMSASIRKAMELPYH